LPSRHERILILKRGPIISLFLLIKPVFLILAFYKGMDLETLKQGVERDISILQKSRDKLLSVQEEVMFKLIVRFLKLREFKKKYIRRACK
jgi:hypothetical protein